VARAARRRVMSIGLMPGSRLPAYCTSMGRVLLAALPEAQARTILQAQPLAARTSLTRTDPEAILNELAKVKEQGFSIIDQEVEIGLRSIAVPIRNAHGQTVAAMNVGVSAFDQSIEGLQSAFLGDLFALQASLAPLLR
jgi:IclR family transcriptional regulator, pca regulon regulatory protein